MIKARKTVLLTLLSIGWLAIVLALYYYRHKPITPDLALNLTLSVYRVAISLGILSLAGGIGLRIISVLPINRPGTPLLASALGFGILGSGFYIGMRLVGVTSLLAWALLIVLGLFFWKDALAFLHRISGALKGVTSSGWLVRVLGSFTGLFLILGLVVAAAPALKYDALVYHLALPLGYLQSGNAAYLPENMFWGMPQVTESLYTWCMLLGGPAAVGVMGWGIGLIAVLGLLELMLGTMGARAAWVGLGALLSGFTIVQALSWAYVEWSLILVGAGILAALYRYLEDGGTFWALLSGILAGTAFGVKYTGAALAAPAGLFLISLAWKRSGLGGAVRQLTVFGAGFLLLSLPWLIKNALATGNPIYPFLFASGAMTAERLSLYQGLPVSLSWLDTLLLPIRATLQGIEGGAGFSASLGPLLLGLGALAWVPDEDRSPEATDLLRVALWVAFGGLLIWAVASRLSGLLAQSRLYAVFFPAFSLLAAGGFKSLAGLRVPGVRVGRVAGSLVLLVLGLNLFQSGAASIRTGAWQVLVGALSRDAYLEHNLGWYAVAMENVRDLPGGARTLMLWEPRGYYCLPRCDSDEVIDRWRYEYQRYQDERAILDAWVKEGNTHLLLHQAGAEFIRGDDERYSQDEWIALDRLISGLTVEQDFGGVYTLYRLSP